MGVYSPTQALQRNQITPSLTISLPLSPIDTIYYTIILTCSINHYENNHLLLCANSYWFLLENTLWRSIVWIIQMPCPAYNNSQRQWGLTYEEREVGRCSVCDKCWSRGGWKLSLVCLYMCITNAKHHCRIRIDIKPPHHQANDYTLTFDSLINLSGR